MTVRKRSLAVTYNSHTIPHKCYVFKSYDRLDRWCRFPKSKFTFSLTRRWYTTLLKLGVHDARKHGILFHNDVPNCSLQCNNTIHAHIQIGFMQNSKALGYGTRRIVKTAFSAIYTYIYKQYHNNLDSKFDYVSKFIS